MTFLVLFYGSSTCDSIDLLIRNLRPLSRVAATSSADSSASVGGTVSDFSVLVAAPASLSGGCGDSADLLPEVFSVSTPNFDRAALMRPLMASSSPDV